MAEYLKPVEAIISTKQERLTSKTINSTGLTYTICDRTNLSDKRANYFISFNLPHQSDELETDSEISLKEPHLQQLNVDKIIMIDIPSINYNEIIDGRSITLKIPQVGTSMSAKTVVSSTYQALRKKEDNGYLGNNIAFLFSDDLNLPYTGLTNGQIVDHSGNTTWNTSFFGDRPAAVAYTQLSTNPLTLDINSDTRSGNYAVNVGSGYPGPLDLGYNYDVPVGIVALDKGFVLITHPDIVNNFPWTSGQTLSDGLVNVSSGTTDIYFSSTTLSTMSFSEIDVEFKNAVVCLALPKEFYFTNNPTWDQDKNYSEQLNNTHGYDSVYVTEVGLYNKKKELIAIAKFDRPIEKTYTNVLNFNLDINV